MMPGVSGAALIRGLGGGGAVPAGAVFHLDFVNGVYWAGGAFGTPASLLGGAFDAAEIGPSGMSTVYSNANRPDAIGDLLSDLQALWLTGFTIVVEIDVPDTAGIAATFLIAANGASYAAATQAAYGYSQAWLATEDWDALYVEGAAYPTLGAAGIHRLGLTFYRSVGGNYESANSIDGSTAATGTTAYDGPGLMTPTRFGILHDGDLVASNTNWVARSITGYAPVDGAALAVLTAP